MTMLRTQRPDRALRIAIIGIKGVPARFGGFETAVDQTMRRLCSDFDITVYNRRDHPAGAIGQYEGIRIRTVWAPRSKHFSTIVHALIATIDAMVRGADIFHFYTAGTAPLAVLPRLLGCRAVVSVDGLDWQRSKWGRMPRAYLRFCERVAAWLADAVVTDAAVLQQYYRQAYGRESVCIAYGGDLPKPECTGTLAEFGLEPGSYYLFVGRLVPENLIDQLLVAWRQVASARKLVIVGDDPWETEYKMRLYDLADDRVVFTGYVFGDGYVELLHGCYAYVFPDEVGGTHPALVEAMAAGAAILANGTAANVEVLGSAGRTWRPGGGPTHIAEGIAELEASPGEVARLGQLASRRASARYTWKRIADQHRHLYESLRR